MCHITAELNEILQYLLIEVNDLDPVIDCVCNDLKDVINLILQMCKLKIAKGYQEIDKYFESCDVKVVKLGRLIKKMLSL